MNSPPITMSFSRIKSTLQLGFAKRNHPWTKRFLARTVKEIDPRTTSVIRSAGVFFYENRGKTSFENRSTDVFFRGSITNVSREPKYRRFCGDSVENVFRESKHRRFFLRKRKTTDVRDLGPRFLRTERSSTENVNSNAKF